MDEWSPKLAWLIGLAALLATGAILFFAWPAARPQIQQALRTPQAEAPPQDAGGGAAPAITENRTVGNSRVHRID